MSHFAPPYPKMQLEIDLERLFCFVFCLNNKDKSGFVGFCQVCGDPALSSCNSFVRKQRTHILRVAIDVVFHQEKKDANKTLEKACTGECF